METDIPLGVKATNEFLQRFQSDDDSPCKSIVPKGEISESQKVFHSTPKYGKCLSPFSSQNRVKMLSPLTDSSKKSPLTFMSQKRENDPCGENGKSFISPLLRKAGPRLSERIPLSPLVCNSSNDSGQREPPVKRCFAATSLTAQQLKELQKLAQEYVCQFYQKFNSSVSHLIVKTEPQGSRVSERTLKFFQAIAHGCWILDFQYVLDCKAMGKLVPELDYEIHGDTVTGDHHYGPKKSRRSKTRKLLEGFQFCVIGDSEGLTPDDLKELITVCHGTVVSHPDKFSDDKLSLVVTCKDMDGDEGSESRSSQDINVFNKLYKFYQVLTVSREWILDSLTLYEVQPLEDYVLTSVEGISIPKI